MGDQIYQLSGGGGGGDRNGPGDPGAVAAAAEPVRTRWTPKPEQILILESIFNSGMVNPSKDETVRIRKLLEKFGSVGDANVFYWFQNRRSRSRRRQRQIMQAAAGDHPRSSFNVVSAGGSSTFPSNAAGAAAVAGASAITQYEFATSSPSTSSNSSHLGFVYDPPTAAITAAAGGCSTTPGLLAPDDDGAEDLFSISRQMGIRDSCVNADQTPPMYPPALTGNSCDTAASLCYHSGLITVFINGSLQEVPRGPFDVRAVFGQDAMLLHSWGELVPMSDYGILFQGLFPGESYFLVPRSM